MNDIFTKSFSKLKHYEIEKIMKTTYNQLFVHDGNYKCFSVIPTNSFYGHEYWIKKYSGWNHPVYALIEHGMFFSQSAVRPQYSGICNAVLTSGDYRYNTIKQCFPELLCYRIGPCIAYANTDDSYREILLEKSKGRKVATVFPIHSVPKHNVQNDKKQLIINVKEICKEMGIDYIRVSLHPEDYKNGIANEYIALGCEPVTSSFGPAFNFLPRQRAIIEASDLTITNDISTVIGYCIYLKKPHIILPQAVKFEDIKSSIDDKAISNKSRLAEEKNEFFKIFKKQEKLMITEKQLELCNYFWGFEHKKTPSDLYYILKNLKHR